MPHTIGTNIQSLSWRSVQNSVCSRRFPTAIGRVKEGVAVKCITVIKNGQFYCSFGTSLASTTIFVCKSYKNEIKYLDFVSRYLASAETQWPKITQVTKSIQVASTFIFIPSDSLCLNLGIDFSGWGHGLYLGLSFASRLFWPLWFMLTNHIYKRFNWRMLYVCVP